MTLTYVTEVISVNNLQKVLAVVDWNMIETLLKHDNEEKFQKQQLTLGPKDVIC